MGTRKCFRIPASFVRITASFVRITASFVHITASFVRITTSFVCITTSFVRITTSFVRITASFVRITASFVHIIASFWIPRSQDTSRKTLDKCKTFLKETNGNLKRDCLGKYYNDNVGVVNYYFISKQKIV